MRLPAALALLPLSLTHGCSHPIDVPAQLAPLRNEALEPNIGTDSLLIGVTTLGECASRYGIRGFSIAAGDEFWVDLTYLGGQLQLSFALDEFAHDEWPSLKQATRDPENFVLSHAAASQATLTSLRVRAGRTPAQTFFRGQVDNAFGLFSPMNDVLGALDVQKPSLGHYRVRFAAPGITVTCERDPDARPDEHGLLEFPHVVEIAVHSSSHASPR